MLASNEESTHYLIPFLRSATTPTCVYLVVKEEEEFEEIDEIVEVEEEEVIDDDEVYEK